MRTVLIVAILIALCSTASIALITQPFVSPAKSMPLQVDAARLEAHVKYLSVDLFPRSFDQFENIEQAAQYILAEFKATGATVSVQELTVEDVTYKNIIAHFGPESAPVLVIGAHYDSHADTTAEIMDPRGYSRETHTPGADDNASGIAGLLELARLLSQSPQSNAIELVAYALEEPPYFRTEQMGSVWHARSLSVAKSSVRLMLSLEMIGYFSDKPGSQSFPLPGMDRLYSNRGNFIALVGRIGDYADVRKVKALMTGATELPVYSINAPIFLPGIDFSDHRSYWDEGIPALMVTDTAFYRNRNYHLADDTFEKLDYARMAKVVQSVYAVTQGY